MKFSATAGIEDITIDLADGTITQKIDVALMAAKLCKAYNDTANRGIIFEAAELTKVFEEYGFPAIPTAALDSIATGIIRRGTDLKNSYAPTPSGDKEPGSALSSESTPEAGPATN